MAKLRIYRLSPRLNPINCPVNRLIFAAKLRWSVAVLVSVEQTGSPRKQTDSCFIRQTIAVTPNRLALARACAHHERKGILKMLIATGERRVMPAAMFIIGLILLWVGVSSRLARRELRNAELAALDSPVRVATFWERDATAAREAHLDKFLEHKNWRNNLRFELINWAIFGIGAALCLLGVVLSLGDDQSHTWDRVWDIVGPFVIAVAGI